MNDKKEDIALNVSPPPEDRKIDNVVLPEYKGEKKEAKKPWTPDIENYIKEIAKLSKRKETQHSLKAKQYMFKYNLFMYISIFLGPFVGMLSAININLNDTRIIPIFILCISFMNGLMISILKFRRWDEGGITHKSSAAKYLALHNDSKRQLLLSNENREDPDEYLKWLSSTMNTLYITSPTLNNSDDEIVQPSPTKQEEKSKITEQQAPLVANIPTIIPQTSTLIKDKRLAYEFNRFLNS